MYVFCITYYELLLCAYKNIYTSLLITAENRRPTAVTKTPPLHHPQEYQEFTAHGSQHLYGIPGGFFQQFPVADGSTTPPFFFLRSKNPGKRRSDFFESKSLWWIWQPIFGKMMEHLLSNHYFMGWLFWRNFSSLNAQVPSSPWSTWSEPVKTDDGSRVLGISRDLGTRGQEIHCTIPLPLFSSCWRYRKTNLLQPHKLITLVFPCFSLEQRVVDLS
jgi:hypothetical protein